MRNVAIIYDAAVAKCSPEQFVAYLSVHRDVVSWSVPFKGLHVVKLNGRANDFFEAVKKIIGNKNIFLAVLDTPKTGGAMTAGFWDWFNADEVTPALIESIRDGEKG